MYEEARHERLIESDWDEEQARAAIDRIVRDTHAHFDSQKLWPVHPLDRIRDDPNLTFRMLYFGAAGVIWALDYLSRVGATTIESDYLSSMIPFAQTNRRDLNLSPPGTFAYLMGDVGILMVRWRLAPTDALAEEIFLAVEGNIRNPARELMWGAPGTMLAAFFIFELTQDERWKEVYLRSVRQMLSEWEMQCRTELLRLDPGPLWAIKQISRRGSWFCRKHFFHHQGLASAGRVNSFVS